jgi:hypothetical protein
MQPLSFQDKLGVSQRLFAAIDEYVDLLNARTILKVLFLKDASA